MSYGSISGERVSIQSAEIRAASPWRNDGGTGTRSNRQRCDDLRLCTTWTAVFPISGSVRCSVIRAISGAGRRIHANYTKDAEEPGIVTAVAPRLSRYVLSS